MTFSQIAEAQKLQKNGCRQRAFKILCQVNLNIEHAV